MRSLSELTYRMDSAPRRDSLGSAMRTERKESMLRALYMLLLTLWITITIAGLVQARTAPTLPESEEQKLEQDFTDPLTTLSQGLIRDSYTPANFGPCTPQSCVRNDETNQLNAAVAIRTPRESVPIAVDTLRRGDQSQNLGPCQVLRARSRKMAGQRYPAIGSTILPGSVV
jgi:hypothetical protein